MLEIEGRRISRLLREWRGLKIAILEEEDNLKVVKKEKSRRKVWSETHVQVDVDSAWYGGLVNNTLVADNR